MENNCKLYKYMLRKRDDSEEEGNAKKRLKKNEVQRSIDSSSSSGNICFKLKWNLWHIVTFLIWIKFFELDDGEKLVPIEKIYRKVGLTPEGHDVAGYVGSDDVIDELIPVSQIKKEKVAKRQKKTEKQRFATNHSGKWRYLKCLNQFLFWFNCFLLL